MADPEQHIGQRVRFLRQERGESQVIVADAVGISRSHLANIELGEDNASWGTVVAIAAYFEASLDWLASGIGEIRAGASRASTQDEALLLYAFRELPSDEAGAILKLILARIRPRDST